MTLGRRAVVKGAAAALWALIVAVLPAPDAAFSASVAGRIRFLGFDTPRARRAPPRVRVSLGGRTGSAARVGGALRMADGAETVVFVCTGDDCEQSGSDEVLKYARQQKPEGVVCKSTGCLGMCGQGPAVAVEAFPGGPLEVTRDVDAGGIDDIFAEIASKSSK